MLQNNSNPTVARTGREKQVYKKGCIRQVAGCVPINRKTGKILLVTRRKKEGGWVLPKGGWENDESEQDAAARETYEEAGAKGKLTSFIGVWNHHAVNKKTGLPKASFLFFEMEVDNLEDIWPEMDERDRQWFAYEDALKALIKPFMREVVKKCSLAPSNIQNNKPGLSILKKIGENRMEISIWQFSIVVIILVIFVWYLTIECNKGLHFPSERLTSFLSITDEH